MSQELIIESIKKIIHKQNLSINEAEEIMREIMSGKITNAQLGALLTSLQMKGETIEEITAFAKIMREFSNRIRPNIQGNLIDTCGTGGDKIKTFNISTISALVVAGAGIPVAKHGNRAVSGICGSADLLEGLGVNINLEPEKVQKCIEDIGIGFMFAPIFHPAMKYAMPTRKELKIRTIFNILGPLTNPANAEYHILGVFQKELAPIMAKVLGNLGGKHIYTVHNSLGIDELAPIGINYITEYYDKKLETYALTNKDFNIPDCSINDILAGSLEDHLKIALNILKNKIHDAKYNTILMNTSLAFKSVNIVKDFIDGIELARETIESNKAYNKLEEFISVTQGNEIKLMNVS